MNRLLLLGGGHAHVKVLAELAGRPLAGWDVHLVTPYRRQIDSGMLPGWVAGHYPIDACATDLDALAAPAAVTLHETAGVGLDLENNVVRCADGTSQRFDLLSIDTGPLPALAQLPGSAEHALLDPADRTLHRGLAGPHRRHARALSPLRPGDRRQRRGRRRAGRRDAIGADACHWRRSWD